MADIVDSNTRSRMMAGIRAKDTSPEITLRKALHARGLRYRLHASGVFGRPDIVFPRFHAAVFVHGCFWHRHPGCRYATTPATRADFWQKKFAANQRRDLVVREHLTGDGWRTAVIWECALRKQERVSTAADAIIAWLRSNEQFLDIGAIDD